MYRLFWEVISGAIAPQAMLEEMEIDYEKAPVDMTRGAHRSPDYLNLNPTGQVPALGLPDGTKDMVVEKTILLEANFDALNGLDWDKGCYMGQELTARTKYRGLIKKRLMPVEVEGQAPAPGTPLMLDGKEAGEMRSSYDGLGIALIRLDRIGDGETLKLEADGATISTRQPTWLEPAAEN